MNSAALPELPTTANSSSLAVGSLAVSLPAAVLQATNLNTNSPNNSNDSSHNLSTASQNSNASLSTLNTLNKVLETQPKSTDSGIGSEKSW